jgi:pimeloyl-ACP methyl ester carboxylesterase
MLKVGLVLASRSCHRKSVLINVFGHTLMEALPTVLIPGLGTDSRLYENQIAALWQFGPVMVANQTRRESMAAIAQDILSHAPPRFALAGLSMGGYVALEIIRQAPERVLKLALLDTTARADTAEQTDRRKMQIEMVKAGRFTEIPGLLFPLLVHPHRREDASLRAIVDEMFFAIGPEAHIRQQTAIMGRADMRGALSSIRCPALIVVGDGDQLTPPALAKEISDGIGGATLVTVPECGHLSTLEQPDIVTRALVEWLQTD